MAMVAAIVCLPVWAERSRTLVWVARSARRLHRQPPGTAGQGGSLSEISRENGRWRAERQGCRAPSGFDQALSIRASRHGAYRNESVSVEQHDRRAYASSRLGPSSRDILGAEKRSEGWPVACAHGGRTWTTVRRGSTSSVNETSVCSRSCNRSWPTFRGRSPTVGHRSSTSGRRPATGHPMDTAGSTRSGNTTSSPSSPPIRPP
jgi:hypothetical protein